MREKVRRKQLRLPTHNYAQTGQYFITICSYQKEEIFGAVSNGIMHLNELGLLVEQEWLHLPERFQEIEVVPFIVMPNHLHAIVTIHGSPWEMAPPFQENMIPTMNERASVGNQGLFGIIKSFKSITTITANKISNTPGRKLWQKNYYEHIIRTDEEYYQTGIYIQQNVQKWNGEI